MQQMLKALTRHFKTMRILFLFSLVFLSTVLYSQKSDSVKVAQLLDNAKKAMNKNADLGFQYLDSIEPFVETTNHNAYQKADYHKVVGIGLYRRSDYDSSTHHYEQALKFFQQGKYDLDVAKISVNLSINYNREGYFERTIQSATRALKMFEQLEDSKGVGISSNIIGQVYFFNEDWTKSKEYFERYLANALSTNDSVEIAGGFSNLGSVFEKQKVFDSAAIFNKKALQIHQELGNKYGIGNAYQNLGANFLSKHIPDSSIFYYEKSLPFYLETNNISGIAEVNTNLSMAYFQLGAFFKAIEYAKKGKEAAEEIGEQYLIQESSRLLSLSLEKTSNYKDALLYYKLYDSTSEEIFNEKTRANIEEINTKYETEKKEQQIALQDAQISEQKAELERNRILLIASIVAIILLFAIGFLLRNRLKKKQQLRLKNAQLKAKENEINATISSQEKERARYARDLHDGFGQMISVLNMNIKSLQDGAKPNERQKVFEASEKVIDEMYGELKNICFDLMPQTLIKHGLESALNEFAGRINQAGKVFVELNVFGLEKRLSELQEISLYRISQEWINNILKYSDATKITLQITKDEGEITLLVEDNGAGFDKSLLMQGKGNGWKNLNTRTKLIQGELELETNPHQLGNVLIVNAPSIIDVDTDNTQLEAELMK